MWLIKISLILIATVNALPVVPAPGGTTGAVQVGEASGVLDRCGTYSGFPVSTAPPSESKNFNPLTPVKSDSSDLMLLVPGDHSEKQSGLGHPLLTQFNAHFQVPLYEVKKPGMTKPMYLLGSNHNIHLESYPELVSRTASMADVLGVEIMGEESLLSPAMSEFGLYNPSGFKWISKLTKENQAKLGLLSVTMDNYHPALVHFLFSRMGVNVFRQDTGINSQLQSAFSVKGKPIFALENRQGRVKMGVGIDPGTLVSYARTFPVSPAFLNDQFAKFCTEIHSEPPLEDLQSYATTDQEALGNLHPIYHTARNENWLPVLLDAMNKRFKDQTILVDVGFLHLPGDKGLLRLLEQENYTVTRVE